MTQSTFRLWAALFCSGLAAIINQIAWQRALKVFLGGSEALSSMIVVAVFIGGLALGAHALRTRASHVTNPMRALGQLELSLAGISICVAAILGLGLEGTVATIQQIGTSLGLPRRMIYGFGAAIILGLPCFLMGLTVPLAAEACQRQLAATTPRVIAWIAFTNTVGAVFGAVFAGYLLIPYSGLRSAMVIAICANSIAAVLLIGTETDASKAPAPPPSQVRRLTPEAYLGALLGFVSLGYEMQLFRIFSLTLEPLPYTFAATLSLFLAVWAAGVALSSARPIPLVPAGVVCSAFLLATPTFYRLDRFEAWRISESLFGIAYFVPVLAFGYLYGLLVTRCRAAWGEDVGAFNAANGLGSCLGVLFFTALGYGLPLEHNAWILSALVLGGVIGFGVVDRRGVGHGLLRTAPFAALALAILVAGLMGAPRFTFKNARWAGFFSPDGVVELLDGKFLWWDGLFHAGLTDGTNHVGNNHWLLAAAPLLARDEAPRDALVIGLGSGITAGTLSTALPGGSVDVYEINPGLEPLLAEFREGTLDVLRRKNLSIFWQDGRSGLLLSPKKYGLITQQPLYLRQAGSGLLLSTEYMRLVQSRLSPGGVFCIYSSSYGVEAQSRLVRATAASVFRYVESYRGGYLLLASDTPMDLGAEAIARRTRLFPMLEAEFAQAARVWGVSSIDEGVDGGAPWIETAGYLITDDHPLVEYPDVATRLLPRRPPAP
jgi:spermidine synthase